MSAETDIARAWQARWEATAAITSAVPGGLTTDEVSQGQALPDDSPLPLPYAVLKIEFERIIAYGHGFHNDSHRVTVELFAEDSKLEVGAIVSAINGAFVWRSTDNPNKLLFPWNVNRFHCFTKRTEDKEGPTDEKRRGRHVRLARMAYDVVTIATEP